MLYAIPALAQFQAPDQRYLPNRPPSSVKWQVTTVCGTGGTCLNQTPYPVGVADSSIQVDTATSNVTLNLPACNSANTGKQYIIKKMDIGSVSPNSVIINPISGDVIDGLSSVSFNGNSQSQTLICSLVSGRWIRANIPGLGGDITGSTINAQVNNLANVTNGSLPNTGLHNAINASHSTIVSANLNYALQTAWITSEVFTFAATAQVTIPQAAFAGQVLNAFVCQSATGGFTPTFVAAAGLSIIGTFPTFIKTPSACGDFSITYQSPTQAYISGSTAGPL